MSTTAANGGNGGAVAIHFLTMTNYSLERDDTRLTVISFLHHEPALIPSFQRPVSKEMVFGVMS